MARRMLNDELWGRVRQVLVDSGCYDSKNTRNVMEAILWKLRTGAQWRDIPSEFCPWKTAYNRFNQWSAKGLWKDFFSRYEANLIRSGYSPTEATFGLISLQVELGVEKKERLESLAAELPPKFTCLPTRMETRSILKSLGVKFTTLKLPIRLFESSKVPSISSQTKATTARPSGTRLAKEE